MSGMNLGRGRDHDGIDPQGEYLSLSKSSGEPLKVQGRRWYDLIWVVQCSLWVLGREHRTGNGPSQCLWVSSTPSPLPSTPQPRP